MQAAEPLSYCIETVEGTFTSTAATAVFGSPCKRIDGETVRRIPRWCLLTFSGIVFPETCHRLRGQFLKQEAEDSSAGANSYSSGQMKSMEAMARFTHQNFIHW